MTAAWGHSRKQRGGKLGIEYSAPWKGCCVQKENNSNGCLVVTSHQATWVQDAAQSWGPAEAPAICHIIGYVWVESLASSWTSCASCAAFTLITVHVFWDLLVRGLHIFLYRNCTCIRLKARHVLGLNWKPMCKTHQVLLDPSDRASLLWAVAKLRWWNSFN